MFRGSLVIRAKLSDMKEIIVPEQKPYETINAMTEVTLLVWGQISTKAPVLTPSETEHIERAQFIC